MIPSRSRPLMRFGALMFAVLLFGCPTDGERGSLLGETCSRTADCVAPLRCVAAVCAEPLDMSDGVGGEGGAGGAGGAADADGSAGEELDGSAGMVDAGEPEPPPTVEPVTLVAIAASVDPSKPLLLVGRADLIGGAPPRLTLELQPLSADAAREPVGVPFEAAAELAEDGRFTLDFGRVLIDGQADPIIPGAPIELELRLAGTLAGGLPCGTVAGVFLQPAMLPLEGTWGSASLSVDPPAEVTPVTRCDD